MRECKVAFFSPEEFCTWALAAYYKGYEEATPPKGDPNPETWSDHETFAVYVLAALVMRIVERAHEQGVSCGVTLGGGGQLFGFGTEQLGKHAA